MKKKKKDKEKQQRPVIYGDPVYSADEDIYAKAQKLELREAVEVSDDNFNPEINPGGDLDVPGTEMDDADEKAGSEDEENNYYSIGGDNHHTLEEDNEDEVDDDYDD